MNALDAMDELTTDEIATDPEYTIETIRAYLRAGGIPTAGWVLALLDEIERLNEAIDATFFTTEAQTIEACARILETRMAVSVPGQGWQLVPDVEPDRVRSTYAAAIRSLGAADEGRAQG